MGASPLDAAPGEAPASDVSTDGAAAGPVVGAWPTAPPPAAAPGVEVTAADGLSVSTTPAAPSLDSVGADSPLQAASRPAQPRRAARTWGPRWMVMACSGSFVHRAETRTEAGALPDLGLSANEPEQEEQDDRADRRDDQAADPAAEVDVEEIGQERAEQRAHE